MSCARRNASRVPPSSLPDIARLLALSLRGLKEGASNSRELRHLIALQVTSLLTAVHGTHFGGQRRGGLRKSR